MKKIVLLFALLMGSNLPMKPQVLEPVDYVNPFIGTTNYGTTNPGAVCPNGLMSCVPFNVMGSADNLRDKDQTWFSTPYEYRNVFFTGFSHVNLSGVGCPELGSLLTCPTLGERQVDYRLYGSRYADEKAEPGYYSNLLTKYGIRTEATATLRTSRERYTFPKGEGHIVLNLGEGLTNESGAWMRKVSDDEYEGGKILGTFCFNYQAVFPLYFVMRVDKKPKASGFWKKQRKATDVEAQWNAEQDTYKVYTRYAREMGGDDIGVWMDFDCAEGEQIEVSMGVSAVSTENARENLEREQAGRSFDELRADARNAWNTLLKRIEVEGGTADQKTIFYTALYHVLLHPNILQDANGDYPLMESNAMGRTQQNRYTVFSLWDTYRNVSPLLTLVYPERQREMIRSMIEMYEESGWMPKWELYGRETLTMDGNPAAAYIADAYLRGLGGFDAEKAYEGLLKTATTAGPDNPQRPYNTDYAERGYIPQWNPTDISVSDCLEYCANDYALSKMADKLGKKNEAALLAARSLNYRRYYDSESGALRPIMPDGTFLTPFNPRRGENFETPAGFHEGSAWHYTFAAAYDVNGLAKLMGGKRKYIENLEKIFANGLYSPDNEPDIVYAYLFSEVKGEEAKTQKWARWALDKYFKNAPNGLPGNDDTGTMSAWAAFTMMGFYPAVPGRPDYTLTAPVFTKITIHLDPAVWGTDRLIIRSDGDDRLTRVKQFHISHSDLLKAGTLDLF